MERCQIFQKSKDTATNVGLYMPSPFPSLPWIVVSMDFLLGLPWTQRGCDSIFVVVDWFSKMAHFIPCKKKTNDIVMPQLYFKEVYRMHGLPSIIMLDWDTHFISHSWQSL